MSTDLGLDESYWRTLASLKIKDHSAHFFVTMHNLITFQIFRFSTKKSHCQGDNIANILYMHFFGMGGGWKQWSVRSLQLWDFYDLEVANKTNWLRDGQRGLDTIASKIEELDYMVNAFIDGIAKEAAILPSKMNDIIIDMADVESELNKEMEYLISSFLIKKKLLLNVELGFW